MTELRIGGETWRNIHTMVRNFLREGDIYPEENSIHYVKSLDVMVHFEPWGDMVGEERTPRASRLYWSVLRIEPKNKKKGWKIYITTQQYRDPDNIDRFYGIKEMQILGRGKEFDRWWAMARLAGYWENRDELEVKTL